MAGSKVVHLHIKEKPPCEADYYFGSMKAIYELFSAKEIGIRYDSLCIALGKKDNFYENRKVSIRVAEMIHKPKASNG